MGCNASRQETSWRTFRQRSKLSSSTEPSTQRKSNSSEETQKQCNASPPAPRQRKSTPRLSKSNVSYHERRMSKQDDDDGNFTISQDRSFKANDRISLAEALAEYNEASFSNGSNHTRSTRTASTRSCNSEVICIVRSDKLSFAGSGIRRHSRRKRRRQSGIDDTRIIVLRKPMRRETCMGKVDERIPVADIKKSSSVENSAPTPRKQRSAYSKKGKSSTASRKSRSRRVCSSGIVIDQGNEDILAVSVRSDDWEPNQ